MALPKDYSPQRRLVMTAVMWAILAGTVGLAAIATRYPAAPRPALEEELEQIPPDLRRFIRTTQPR